MRPKGLVTVSGIKDAEGYAISLQRAVDYGWITPARGRFAGWGLGRDEIPLGENLFVDQGRQLVAFCFGGRSPVANYFCANFGVGTGTTVPNVTDTALQAPAYFASTVTNAANGNGLTCPIDSVDFLAPFVVRVTYTIAAGDCNGLALTERGLFSGGNVLFARQVTNAAISKQSSFSPTLLWRLKF